VVLLRALESRGVLESVNGRIAVGWLVVEDLVMVLVLVLLPALSAWLGGNAATPAEGAGDQSLLTTLALTLGRVSFLLRSCLLSAGASFPQLLWQIARTGSREHLCASLRPPLVSLRLRRAFRGLLRSALFRRHGYAGVSPKLSGC
jgi:CPA2 family monovalent cation:H+ antiporter-2